MQQQTLALPARLAAIREMLGEWHGVADIGTDHGLLPIDLALASLGSAGPIVATDIAEGPLRSAARAILAAGVGDYVDVRLGAGLSVLRPGEVTAVVIAGMGHRSIMGILEDELRLGSPVISRVERLVLQANGLDASLREWLVARGFGLAGECVVSERGHHYVIDLVSPTSEVRDRSKLDWVLLEMEALGVGRSTVLAVGPLLIADRQTGLLGMLADEQARLVEAHERAAVAMGERVGSGRTRLRERLKEVEVIVEWVCRSAR